MNSELLKMVITEEEEVRAACRAKKDELGFDIEKAMFPHHPFEDAPLREISIDDAIILSREFGLARASVGASVGASVRASVGASVGASVWDSVRASVGDLVGASAGASVWAYVSSIFFNVEKWEDVDHVEGVNPFQSSIDLWGSGYIPVYIDSKIQLYTKDGLIWEGE